MCGYNLYHNGDKRYLIRKCEVIITEQNKKNSEEFGATRTFSVTSNSAEAMKNKINSTNEQNLSRKSAEVRQVRRSEHSNDVQARHTVSSASSNLKAENINSSARAQNSSHAISSDAQRSGQSLRGERVSNSAGVRSQQVRRSNQSGQNENYVRPAQNVQKNQQRNRSVVPSDSVRNHVRSDKRPAAAMMQTKQNSVVLPVNKSAKPLKTEKNGNFDSGYEGGNTVVSVIKAVIYIIFVIVISVFLAFGIITIGNDVFAFVKSDEVVEISIPEYATLDDVAQILFENDIIKYPQVFKLYAVAKNDDGEFLAGNYSVTPMTNYGDLLDSFKEQPITGIVRITIPEGSTTDEIIDIFVSKGIGTREGFVDVIENYDFDYWFVDELEANGIREGRIYRLDGYLFPDTYDFYLNSSEYTVINKLLKRFTQIFTKEYRDQCAEFGYTVDEMVTLASIIEKEAGSASEFFTVSSVFHNRLNAPSYFPKFESDATIVYAISHEKGERTAITAADLSYDTPYNTYLYEGFPPGPIANPSASALLAALSPQTTNYYFFIANRGTTYFSETKEQHNAYIAQFKAESQTDN